MKMTFREVSNVSK